MTSPMLEDGLVPVIPFTWLDGNGLLRNGSRERTERSCHGSAGFRWNVYAEALFYLPIVASHSS
jgi:hypothetical protein